EWFTHGGAGSRALKGSVAAPKGKAPWATSRPAARCCQRAALLAGKSAIRTARARATRASIPSSTDRPGAGGGAGDVGRGAGGGGGSGAGTETRIVVVS